MGIRRYQTFILIFQGMHAVTGSWPVRRHSVLRCGSSIPAPDPSHFSRNCVQRFAHIFYTLILAKASPTYNRRSVHLHPSGIMDLSGINIDWATVRLASSYIIIISSYGITGTLHAYFVLQDLPMCGPIGFTIVVGAGPSLFTCCLLVTLFWPLLVASYKGIWSIVYFLWAFIYRRKQRPPGRVSKRHQEMLVATAFAQVYWHEVDHLRRTR